MFTPSRLTLARKRRGLTKKRVAELTDLSVRSITAFEAGDLAPSALTLTRLADVLDFPVAFFSAPDLEEIPDEAASFRSMSKMTASQRHVAQGAGELAIAFHDWISARFRLPAASVPTVGHGVDPETAAGVVRSEWGLGEKPIPNVIHLLEVHGIRVFSLAQECREVDAFSLWRRDQPFVFLNTQKSAEHSRFDAAHELGHLVMHWHHDVPQGKRAEQEASQFASAFLMPAAGLLPTAPRFPSLSGLIAAKRLWKVSLAALAYRLNALTVLTDWHYRQLCIEMSQRGYRTQEPASIRRETSQVLNKVFAALRKEGVGKAAIANALCIHPRELDAFVFDLAIVPVDSRSTQFATPSDIPTEFPKLRLV